MGNPYPESVFPSLTTEEVLIVVRAIEAAGFTSDRVHGAWGRYVWDKCQEATLREVGEWLEKNTSIWGNLGLDKSDFMVITLSAEYANRAIQALLQGKMPEGTLDSPNPVDDTPLCFER